ncbi:MAG: hypothetical protein PHG48_08405, partial [Eubacteriales bacterium]|nr:hypothetical protein [Eubacteriales bacterium]
AHEAPGDSVLINTDKKGIILNMRRPDGLARAAESIRIIGRTQEAVMRNVNFQLCISAMLMKLREPCI